MPHSVLQIKTGVITSKNAIKKLSIKLGEYSGQYLSAPEALKKLKGTWKEYRAAKKTASALRKIPRRILLLEKLLIVRVPQISYRR